jgi:hypothetical protein
VSCQSPTRMPLTTKQIMALRQGSGGRDARRHGEPTRSHYRKRCERGLFTAIKEVRLRDGGLRITLADGNNWDFYGSDSDIRLAHEAISAVLARRSQQ